MTEDRVNILLVDDQPAKLLTYRTILEDVGENLLSASNATEALELLLRHDVAVVLIDVYMPDIDGFQLAAMIRNHPRFEKTALIFISAILLTDVDRLRGYEMGAVDYVPVPVIPEVLRAKVKVFVELFRKTRQLEQLNKGLEARVAERTAALAASTLQLRQSERMRSLALAAGQMGSWEWNVSRGSIIWDQGQCEIFGVDRSTFVPTLDSVRPLINPEDFELLERAFRKITKATNTFQTEFRVLRPNGEVRWCTGTAAANFDEVGRLVWLSGVTSDITDRKRAEERQILLAEEVDHRARNVVAVVQSIMRLLAPTISTNTLAPSMAGSARCRTHTACWRGRAGKVPIFIDLSKKSLPPIARAATNELGLADRSFCCHRPPLKPLPWRCMNSRQTRRNMARCLSTRVMSTLVGGRKPESSNWSGRSPAVRRSPLPSVAAMAAGPSLQASNGNLVVS